MLIHAIVLLPEMFPSLDWKKIGRRIKEGSNMRESVVVHVLDLAELQRLCVVSKVPSVFSDNLLARFHAILRAKNGLVRGKISPCE
jgi:hypothetical protein